MIDTVLSVAASLITFMGAQWGSVGTVIAYLIVWGIPIISVLIEILEFVVAMTPSTSDDEWAKKVKEYWAKIMPWMEALPHVNLPLSTGAQMALKYIVKGAAALKGAISGWFSKE